MHKGDLGAPVADLQRRLNAVGLKLAVNAVFDAETEAAVIAFQLRAGLVADGWAGAKTMAALLGGERDRKRLSEADLARAAGRLGVPVASIKAVNAVESNGAGFLPDGRPKILYERHVAYRLAAEAELAPELFWQRSPNVLNPQRGGYIGGAAEWSRLSSALQVLPAEVAYGACSWGQYQIMGYHWAALGYDSIEQFVEAMKQSEGLQLDAFCRFIEADPALFKALKAKKWADFARLFNGPAYKENLYDVKLSRAYDRYAEPAEASA